MDSSRLVSFAVIQLSCLFAFTGGRTFLPVPFDCRNGKLVPRVYVCDGENDCGNGADERNCHTARFDCGNGYSLPSRFLCDGNNDCTNGADEKNCDSGRFDCGNGYSVPRTYLCDGDDDCRNEADEKDCEHVTSTTKNPGNPVSSTTENSVSSTSENPGNPVSSTTENPGNPVSSTTENLGNPVSSTTETPVCGGTLIAQPSENEFVSHPKFGDHAYGENITCDWIIKSSSGRNVKIRFPNFDVGVADKGCENPDTGNCGQNNTDKESFGKDFVEIYVYGGSDDSRKLIGRYAGNQRPPTITSEREDLLVRFRSGDTGSFWGFRALYQEV